MKYLSIRNILLSTIMLLTLLIAALASKEVYIEGKKLTKIYSLQEASSTSDILFEVVEKYTIARDLTSSMAYAPDDETIKSLTLKVTEAQKQADEVLNTAVFSLKKYDFPEINEKIRENTESLEKLKLLRYELKQAVVMHETAKRDELATEWFQQVTSHIREVQDIWMLFIKNFSDIDPSVTLQLRFKHFLGIIMEYSGRERAIIGQLIVQNKPPSPEQQANLLIWHGAVQISWERLNSLSVQGGLSTHIYPSMKDAESHYMNLHNMVKEMFYTPGNKFHGYPIDINFWLEVSGQTTDSFYELKNLAVQKSKDYRVILENEANKSIILNILVVLFSFGVCLYSLWVVISRVINPINIMVTNLLDVVAGKYVKTSGIPYNNDEVGKLGKVLSALQTSVKRYRALVDASAQIIWTWQPGETGELEAFKTWWEDTTGQPQDEILPFGWLKFVHEDDREEAGNAWRESTATGNNFNIEYRILAKDGSYKHVSARGIALKNDDGSINEFVGAISDITLRKEAEIHIHRYMEDLERSNKELDDFAYIASHDLKEPLRGIHNHSRFLLEDNGPKLDTESVDRLGRLVYLSQRMERLVNDLLYFSRLGRQELAIKDADINEIVKDIEDTLDLFLKEHNAKISIGTPFPQFTCDQVRVTELLRNLITNAIKYNDKPEKTVEIGFLESHLTKTNTTFKNVFYVKDNGNGIPEEFFVEIFRIFKRLQNVKNKEEQGTGVGLTFVKKIVERHGGKIWLESEINQGTTFYFTLEA